MLYFRCNKENKLERGDYIYRSLCGLADKKVKAANEQPQRQQNKFNSFHVLVGDNVVDPSTEGGDSGVDTWLTRKGATCWWWTVVSFGVSVGYLAD